MEFERRKRNVGQMMRSSGRRRKRNVGKMMRDFLEEEEEGV